MDDYPEYFEADDIERRRSKSFLLLGVSAYLDMDVSEAITYITDGGHDGGFDAAYIEEAHDGQVNVVLFQSKYTRDFNKETNFPANAIEKAVNTVKTVFDPALSVDLNEFSKRVVDEIRSLILDGYVPYVTFVMLSNGDTWNPDGQKYIDNAFGTQEQVQFEHFGYNNILGYIQRKNPINAEINMSGNAIQENFNYKRVIVGKVNIAEIIRLMETYGDLLLEKNIRKYLGRNEINDSISKTLCCDDKSNFFFYNNGITMICEQFNYNALQEKDWIVRTNGLQIINGGQTCRAIMQTYKDNPELEMNDVYVLVRIYEVNDEEDIVNAITYATNHQNPVDLRDLKSNDSYQRLLEVSAKDLGYIYKRKRDNSVVAGTIPATVAAEAVLAVWRKSPHLSRYKKAELFGAYYDDIFKNLNAAQMIIAVQIFRFSDSMRKKKTDNKELQAIRGYSNYFVACMMGIKLCDELNLKVDEITHVNFNEIIEYFDANKEGFLSWAEEKLISILHKYFDLQDNQLLSDIDGRTLAAAFRRFNIVEDYFKNDEILNV